MNPRSVEIRYPEPMTMEVALLDAGDVAWTYLEPVGFTPLEEREKWIRAWCSQGLNLFPEH